MSGLGMVTRRVKALAVDRMQDDPVVLLEGARSVGKSTLLREFARDTGATLIDLDDLATRDAVAACRPPGAWDHRGVSAARGMGPPFRQ